MWKNGNPEIKSKYRIVQRFLSMCQREMYNNLLMNTMLSPSTGSTNCMLWCLTTKNILFEWNIFYVCEIRFYSSEVSGNMFVPVSWPLYHIPSNLLLWDKLIPVLELWCKQKFLCMELCSQMCHICVDRIASMSFWGVLWKLQCFLRSDLISYFTRDLPLLVK